MRFVDVYSEMRESEKKLIRFNDLMPFVFYDDTKDKNGAVHSDKNGQFVSKEGSGEKFKPRNKDPSENKKFDEKKYRELLGVEFKGVKRRAAVRKLINEKKGHVKNAFHRKEIGDIDLIWGNEKLGLDHIIQRRKENNPDFNVEDFVDDMASIIENGEIYYNQDTKNYEIWSNKKLVIITREFFGKDIRLVITEFPSRKMPKRFKRPGI